MARRATNDGLDSYMYNRMEAQRIPAVSIEQSTFSDTSIKAAIKALKRQVQAACREKGVMCTRRKALSLYAGGCILVINCRGDVRGDC